MNRDTKSRSVSVSGNSLDSDAFSSLLGLEERTLTSEARTRAEPTLGPAPEERAPRRPYRTPVLTRFGDLRDLTLGGSPGTGESGMPFNFQPLGGTERN